MAVHTGIKVAAKLASDPEQTKKLLCTVLITVLAVLALPSIALLGIRALLGEGEITEEFDITETEIYQAVFPVYKSYMDKQTEEMKVIAEQIVEENTITVQKERPGTDPVTGESITIIEEVEICTVDVYVICNHMDFAYLLSYLSVKNEEIVAGEKYRLKEKELTDFLSSIQDIKIQHLGSNYFIYNQFRTMDEIERLTCGEDETERGYFQTVFQNYKEFLGEVTESENFHFGGADEAYKNDIQMEGNSMGIPEMYQYLGAWADYPYGDGTIRDSGCAIACLAMVTSYMKSSVITPLDIVDFTGNRYYVDGVGSSWSIFPAVASHYGYNCSSLGKDAKAIISALESGHPVIASMGPGTFTSTGHFIVLKGITEDGRILVNDPNDSASKNYNRTEFNLNLILSQGKNFWRFY